MIRNATPADAEAIKSIYNYYIENTTITFEETPVTEKDIAQRISSILNSYPYLVYVENGEILGYAYASEWRARRAYRYTVETTVYVKPGVEKKGIGTLLYDELIKQLTKMEFRALVACITIPNDKSVRLHEKYGFKKVGHFEQVGLKFGEWLDVGFWEKTLTH